MNVLVVTPTYNERENLPAARAPACCKHDGFRLLVVDDGSPDGTGAIADQLAAEHPGPRRGDAPHRPARPGPLLHRRAAARDREGTADYICQMDCDLSHDPDVPARRSSTAAATHDLVIGSRYLNGGVSVVNWPIHRIFLSAFAQPLHPAGHQPLRERLHQRLSLLAARSARAAADRRHGLGRLRLPGRDALRSEAARASASAKCRSSSSSGAGQSKLSSNVLIESLIMPWRLVLRAAAPLTCAHVVVMVTTSYPRFPGDGSARSWSRSRRASPRAATRSTSSRRGIRASRAARSRTASSSISSSTRRCRR